MAYVQVNNASHALRIATFIVAFFSSFFCLSAEVPDDFDFSGFTGVPAKVVQASLIKCSIGIYDDIGRVELKQLDPPRELQLAACASMTIAYLQSLPAYNLCPDTQAIVTSPSVGFYDVEYTASSTPGHWLYTCDFQATSHNLAGGAGIVSTVDTLMCPPDSHPLNTVMNEELCYNYIEINKKIEEDNKSDDECIGFLLDSGNNSADNLCYTSDNGKSCNVQKVTTDGGGSYYKGVSSSEGGCFTSEHPPFDDAGTGEEKDNCLFSEGVNYCQANRDKHCSTTVGVEICDDGCIDDGINLFCDTSRHPDVGEGDSNYFDDNGTCSVISASSSRGFCEDNDGVWDETQDYQETSCPAGAGTCSVAVAGLCGSCFDAGGTWTPDPTALLSDEAKVGIENQALVKTGNDKLTQIEHGQRKTAEATQSTIKSGNAKVVAAIESLGEKLSKPNEEEEKESFTVTTSDIEKSKINSLFDAAATATLTAEIETLKADITTSINSIRAEASSMMSITVPASTGYEARNLTLTQGTFDLSLNRFSGFFQALAMPVMLLCSILAGLILLGGKN